MEGEMTRRTMLVGAAIALAAPAAAAEHEHHGMGHGTPAPYPALVEAARDCRATGENCLAHCLVAFRAGDTTLAECATEVNRMLAACESISRLGTYGSPHTPAFAKACAALCADCEKACREHEDKHPECKACADACARFRKAVAALGA